MNTEQQAQQLRLAADIIETGHPWEFQDLNEWHSGRNFIPCYPAHCLTSGHEIRLILATPPDGRPLHNPDGLTAEQVGAGYRLVCYDDKTHVEKLEKWTSGEWLIVHSIGQLSFRHCGSTYRVPLSVPWPSPKPYPYAELKAAQAEGKTIQVRPKKRTEGWHEEWQDCVPEWRDDFEYRIKPEPTFQLPPPPPGMRWHREDGWQEGDLPQGWRPLVYREQPHEGDEQKIESDWMLQTSIGLTILPTEAQQLQRTRRPLTFEHAGKSWSWHRPGDPMPCDEEKKVACVFVDHRVWDDELLCAHEVNWGADAGQGCIIGWRYADEKKTVPLDQSNIPPCSVITGKDGGWAMVTGVGDDGVTVDARDEPVSFDELKEHAKINRPRHRDADGNPTLWEPCSKEVAV